MNCYHIGYETYNGVVMVSEEEVFTWNFLLNKTYWSESVWKLVEEENGTIRLILKWKE